MGDLMNENDQQENLISADQFIQDLNELEHKNYENNSNKNMPRMSLLTNFDPLIESSQKIKQTPIISNIHVPSIKNNHNISITTNDDGQQLTKENDESLNQSGILIHLNKNNLTSEINNDSPKTNGNPNSLGNIDSHNQIIQMNEEIGILESKNENLEILIGQLAFVNEEIIDCAMKKISTLQETIDSKDEELNKLSIIKVQLEEDINGIEKNYYEIHSRYDHLRSLVKEMDERESQNKSKIQELSTKLKEKTHDCLKLKQQAEEAIESANQRLQTVANNETISLKAQVKVLEMRINSLQSQITQKNRENEELSNIVNELIANNKTN